jgi:AcrR family transcriptional regulator
MRIVKDHEVRMEEILDAAEYLFNSKGYLHTTVNDILREVGIAKGTFYYYFPSKEALLDAVINRIVGIEIKRCQLIVNDARLSVLEKFAAVLLSGGQENRSREAAIEMFNRPSNAQMHEKSFIETTKQLTPLLEQVVRQGIEEGLFETEYPRENIELLLISGQMLFDRDWFRADPERMVRQVKAFCNLVEKLLGTKGKARGKPTEYILKSVLGD